MNLEKPEYNGHIQQDASSAPLPLVVGVDLGGTQIRAAVLQGAKLLSRVSTLTGSDTTPDQVIPRMVQAVNQAIAEAETTLDQIAGIGIGAPGPLNNRTGVVYSPPNLRWIDVHLRDIFHEHFAVPVFVENDANAAALAEYMFGAGRGTTEMVYMTISTGIGGGVIAEGRILEGIVGTAGELGHMTIDMHGPVCNCGNIGCLESLASGTAIARRANELIALGKGQELLDFALTHDHGDGTANTKGTGAIDKPTSFTPVDSSTLAATPIHINARTVAQAAQAGIPLAQHIISEAAQALGFGLVNIIHIFNPELIILGGGITQIGEPLLGPAQRVVQQHAMRVPRESARIALAQLGSDVGLVGAGTLVHYKQQVSA